MLSLQHSAQAMLIFLEGRLPFGLLELFCIILYSSVSSSDTSSVSLCRKWVSPRVNHRIMSWGFHPNAINCCWM